jgi:hypothetical protein
MPPEEPHPVAVKAAIEVPLVDPISDEDLGVR